MVRIITKKFRRSKATAVGMKVSKAGCERRVISFDELMSKPIYLGK